MTDCKSHLLSLALLMTSSAAFSADYTYNLLPSPTEITYTGGESSYDPALAVAVKGTDARDKLFASAMSSRSVTSVATAKPAKGALTVTLSVDTSLPEESYTLTVNKGRVEVKAAGDAGFYYAAQTLSQMLRQAVAEKNTLRDCTIKDSPRFGYRGMMIDVVRCYVPVDELMKLIDQASSLKINNVHLHLTDDNGWRLEIRKYPRLTEVGAWRVSRPEIFPARLNARSADEPALYGGFYTQEQMKQLVKYAAERNVNIIPEIEMPAHSAAAIASYPELSCPPHDHFIGVFPGIGGQDANIIICGGNDDALTFYKDVLDEVFEIFPSKQIHLGGDEANKSRWKECEKCNERINSLGLKDYEALQGWFMNQIADHVIANGRTPMGWDEATYGNPTKEMTIMGWQGTGKIAVKDARKTGRKFIMTPAQKLYLIRYQGPQWFEPFTYFGNNTLSDIYNYEPVDQSWTTEMETQLQGIQGSLWSEFCSSGSDMEYLLFPRMLAVAELAWAPKGRRDWPGFIASADNMLAEMSDKGLNWAPSMYNIQHKVITQGDGNLSVTLTNERPDMEIRYAMGNTDVANGNTYTSPITTAGNTTIYAATYDKNGIQHGQMLSLPITSHKAAGRKVLANATNGQHQVLTNGVRGSYRNSDFEWAGWHNGEADFTIDLGAPKDIESVSVGSLVYADLCIALPSTVTLLTSKDGETYETVDTVGYTPEQCFNASNKIVNTNFTTPRHDVRFIRVKATNPGHIPAGMAREGAPTWMYFDEVTVR